MQSATPWRCADADQPGLGQDLARRHPAVAEGQVFGFNLTFINLVRTAWSPDEREDFAQVGR